MTLVATFRRTLPSGVLTVTVCKFGRKKCFFLGARRFHAPLCGWRIRLPLSGPFPDTWQTRDISRLLSLRGMQVGIYGRRACALQKVGHEKGCGPPCGTPGAAATIYRILPPAVKADVEPASLNPVPVTAGGRMRYIVAAAPGVPH